MSPSPWSEPRANADHPLAAFGLDMLARGAARLRGGRVAIAEAGAGADAAVVTYRDLDRQVLAFSAQALDCGLKPGERVLVVGAARVGVTTALLGALGAGLEPVIAPAHMGPPALAFLAQSTGAAALIGPTRFGAFDAETVMLEIAAAAPAIRLLGSLGPGQCDGAVDFSPEGLRSIGDPAVRAPRNEHPPRIGLVLGVREKAPRATFVSQADIVACGLDLASRLRLTADLPILSTLSPASFAGLVAGPVAALLAGASLTWFGPFESRGFLATLEQVGRCTLVAPAAIAGDLSRAGLTSGQALESLALSLRPGEAVADLERLIDCPLALLSTSEDGRLEISSPATLETAGLTAHSS